MKDGMKMETKDGKVIVMSGNETARLFMQLDEDKGASN